MARAMWKGSLNFGLVNIPVQLQPATSEKDLHFHLFHDADGGRIREKRVCEKDGKEVPYEHVVKGFEQTKGEFVTLTPEELKAMDPVKDHTLSIEGFVKLEEIDPIFFERAYHVVAEGKSTKAYALLSDALEKTDRVAIGRIVLSTKEHLCAVQSVDGALRMMTLAYGDEVVAAPSHERAKPSAKELEMAQALIAQMAMKFEPKKLVDTHRDRVLELIAQKAKGKTISVKATPVAEKISDLTAALERSLAAVKAPAAAAASTRAPAARHRPHAKSQASHRTGHA